jgi:hypothetical protein
MEHVRGAPYHPQTQGKLERWHQTLKNRILLENYYLPGDLEREIKAFILLIGFGEPISLWHCRCRKVSVARFPADGRKPMTVRTTRTTISFSQPFKLRDVDDIQPAGDYLLDTDEELIEGLSRLAYRRVATLLHLPSTSRPQSRTELLSVNPAELDAALEKDRVGRA